MIRYTSKEFSDPELSDFFDYWNTIKGARFAPSWKSFDMLQLAPKSIPRLIVVDVIYDPFDLKVRFWGTGHTERKGIDKTGLSVNSVPNSRRENTLDEYRMVIEDKIPIGSLDLVKLSKFNGRTDFSQKCLRLPLSDDGEQVHNVISLSTWA